VALRKVVIFRSRDAREEHRTPSLPLLAYDIHTGTAWEIYLVSRDCLN
jgi:hypothetical protein